MKARRGDQILIPSRKVGQEPKRGVITDVMGSGENPELRVRWSDGHESLYRPATGSARIIPKRGR